MGEIIKRVENNLLYLTIEDTLKNPAFLPFTPFFQTTLSSHTDNKHKRIEYNVNSQAGDPAHFSYP